MRRLKWLGWGAALALAALGMVYGMGAALPESRTSQASGIIAASPDRLWDLITDPAQQVNWRTGIWAISFDFAKNGMRCWVELQPSMDVPLCVVNEQPERKMVVEIEDPKLPVSGQWTFELAPAAGGTRVTITDRATIRSPFWRFKEHYIIRRDEQVELYLRDLAIEAVRTR